MGTLKCLWLGYPVVELDTIEIRMETRKATAMLAYLCMTPGSVNREQLATMLWPEFSQQKALANLRRVLSSLRERLPLGVLESDREKVTLGGDGRIWVDVAAFEQNLLQVRKHKHLTGEYCDECLARLKEAIRYYRGSFLEGFNLGDAPEFDDWQAYHRQEYQEQFAWALEVLSGAEAARGELEQAVSHAHQWVILDRLNEKSNRWLMELYEKGGRRNAALHQYLELAKLLKVQVGEDPEIETKMLYERMQEKENRAGYLMHPSALPLLKTKLYIPTLPANYVARPRLVARLDEVKNRAMLMVSAPAGFGKTTLLVEWIAQTKLPIAWLSLDAGDNDPYRFLAYLLAALESLEEGVGVEARQLLQSPQMIPTHIILASLINDLGKISETYALVLDDYQFITDHEVHDVLSYLLNHLPMNMHVLMATRSDPPIPSGRLRSQGELLELRTDDLRFSREEVKEFLSDVISLDLPDEDIQVLEARTEGWVAGVKMAALSLKDIEDPSAFIHAFSGSTRHVLDYLVEEVIKRQQPRIQFFLLVTSILEKMNSQLCTCLVGEEGQQEDEKSQETLEYLERNNLFVIPLDDERTWFRYHHLFGDLLQMKLRQSHPNKEKELHQTAALWFAEHSHPGEAIAHALAAMNFSLAADLVERFGLFLIMRSEIATVLKWISELPAEITRSRPRLLIYQAWVLARMGEPGDLETILQEAEALLCAASRSPETDEMRDYVTQLHAYIANLRGDSDMAIQVAMHAREHPRGTLPPLSGINYLVGFQLGYAHTTKGDLATAETIFRSVAKSAEEQGDLYNAIIAQVELAGIHALHGKISQAQQLYQSTHDWIGRKVENPSLLDGILKTCLANILLERNELEKAGCLVREGIDHARLGSRTNTLIHGYVILAQILRAQGELTLSREATEQAANHLHGHRIYPRTHQYVRICQLEQLLADGNLAAARRSLFEELQPPSTPSTFAEEPDNIIRTRVLLADGEFKEAAKLLDDLAKAAEAGGRTGRLIKIKILQAMVLQGSGKTGEALQILAQSVDQAYPEGYMRAFLDEGVKLEDLLRYGKQQGRWQEPGMAGYIDSILDSFVRQKQLPAVTHPKS